MPQDTVPGNIDSLKQVLAIKANDEKALKHLYQNNYPTVERYVLNNNGTGDEAKDIFQEAFISLWRNIQLDKFQPQREASLDAYLFRIAKNKWMDHLRSNKRYRKNSIAGIERLEETSKQLGKEEEDYLEKVKLHYAYLGAPCKDVLYRFYFLKQSMMQIAEFFSWTEATAKNNKYRCLQKLRNMVLTKKKR